MYISERYPLKHDNHLVKEKKTIDWLSKKRRTNHGIYIVLLLWVYPLIFPLLRWWHRCIDEHLERLELLLRIIDVDELEERIRDRFQLSTSFVVDFHPWKVTEEEDQTIDYSIPLSLQSILPMNLISRLNLVVHLQNFFVLSLLDPTWFESLLPFSSFFSLFFYYDLFSVANHKSEAKEKVRPLSFSIRLGNCDLLNITKKESIFTSKI